MHTRHKGSPKLAVPGPGLVAGAGGDCAVRGGIEEGGGTVALEGRTSGTRWRHAMGMVFGGIQKRREIKNSNVSNPRIFFRQC